MRFLNSSRFLVRRAAGTLALTALATTLVISPAVAGQRGEPDRGTLVLTSTNDPGGNQVVVFALKTGGAPALSLRQTLPTGGKGGASGNAGILQVREDLGAVANYGSNSVI